MVKKLTALISITFLFLLTVSVSPAYADCSPALSGPPALSFTKDTMKGSVHLRWNPITNASKYALVYGFSGMPFMFGSLNLHGNNQSHYIVSHLESGKSYNFQVWAFCRDEEAPTMSNVVTQISP